MNRDIKSMDLPELTEALAELGEPKFRAKQLFTWLHRGARTFDEMTNLSKALREKLRTQFDLNPPEVARRQASRLDGTVKYLWRLADGNCVESVLMRYHHGNTVCISSEVGCAMGCAFCASTLGGLVRRLTPAEMLDQVLFTQLDSGLPISNIVLMGIGEPLDNYDLKIPPPGQSSGRAEHRDAPHQPLHLRPGAANCPVGRGGFAADAFRFPPRPHQRHPQPDHAGEQGIPGGGAGGGVPAVF